MSDHLERILTVVDYFLAARRADERGDRTAQRLLAWHHPYAQHCQGWEVLAWPCPIAARVVRKLEQEAA